MTSHRPTFGQRLPRPRRTQPVPIHQMRLDTVLRVGRTDTGQLLYLMPGGLVEPERDPEPDGDGDGDAPVAAVAARRTA